MYFYQWPQLIFALFILITFIQLLYYFIFFARLAFYQPKQKTVTQTHPVSVIICARDEAANLAKNLPGSLVQKYPTTHEIIVVNDNSFDDTKYVLEELKKQFKQLQIIELKQEAKLIPGKKFPLSVGIKSARHEILLLTDADCVPASENWIFSMQQAYDDNIEIVLGYGAYHKLKGTFNKVVRWETFHTALQYLSYTLAGLPYMGVGRNLSYKKKLFYQHKGFSAHNKIPSGDDDLFINMTATRKNTRINIDKDSFTLSDPAKTFSQWIRQKNRHYTTSKHYKKVHQFLLGIYSLTHFLFFPLFILSIIFFSWKWSLIAFGSRFLVQLIVFYKCMRKLNEQDLYPYFLLFDIGMFFYYLKFSIALIKKPKPTWK